MNTQIDNLLHCNKERERERRERKREGIERERERGNREKGRKKEEREMFVFSVFTVDLMKNRCPSLFRRTYDKIFCLINLETYITHVSD